MGSGISYHLQSEETAFSIIHNTGQALEEVIVEQRCTGSMCQRMVQEKSRQMCDRFSPGQLAWACQRLGLSTNCQAEEMAVKIAEYYLNNRFSDNHMSDNRFSDNRFNDNRFNDNRFNDNRFNDQWNERPVVRQYTSQIQYSSPKYSECNRCPPPQPVCPPPQPVCPPPQPVCPPPQPVCQQQVCPPCPEPQQMSIEVQTPPPVIYSPRPQTQLIQQKPIVPVHTVQGTPNVEPKRYRVTGEEITRTNGGIRVRNPKSVVVTQTVPKSKLDDFSRNLGKQTRITSVETQLKSQNIPRGTPVRALADHRPTTTSELPLRAGQLTTYLEPGPRDWALVSHGPGSVGYVPGSHLTL